MLWLKIPGFIGANTAGACPDILLKRLVGLVTAKTAAKCPDGQGNVLLLIG